MLVSALSLFGAVMMTYSESWQEKLLRESVQVETDEVDRANNLKLVCFTTTPESNETLCDPEFGVTLPKAVRLKRVVEMLQWKEKKEIIHHSKGSPTITYSYSQHWSSPILNSKRFKEPSHKNPTKKPFKTKIWNAETLSAGCYKLDEKQISKLNSWKPLPISEVKTIPEPGVVIQNNISYRYGPSAIVSIGDLRVSFFYVEPSEVTICGEQKNDRIRPYNVSAEEQIHHVEVGRYQLTDFITPQIEEGKSMGLFMAGLSIFFFFLGLSHIIRKVPPLLVIEEDALTSKSPDC